MHVDRITSDQTDGYRGIWYCNEKTGDEYVYKYSGGLGTYTAYHIPMAYYAAPANRTFFVYGGTAEGQPRLLIMASYYDHERHRLPRPTVLCDRGTDDAHDNPVVSVDDAGYVWVFASSHGRGRPSYIFRSREPYTTESFEQVAETNFSYPQVHYLTGQGFFFLHTLYNGGRGLHWATSPDGRRWDGPHRLSHIARGHYAVSWRQGDRIGTAFNYHPEPGGLNFRTNLYYVETDDFGRSWHNAQGDRLELPLQEVRNPALAHDYESEGLKVYVQDLNYDTRGRPIILYITSPGWQPGPQNDPRIWTTAHWNGERWEIRGSIVSDNNYDTGCLHVDADGTWRLIGPTEPGPQPGNPGGEIAIWTSGDEGATWRKQRALTRNSIYNHTFVRRPAHANPQFHAFWADGHGRQPSESRLYFADRSGEQVWRLPAKMAGAWAEPEPVSSDG